MNVRTTLMTAAHYIKLLPLNVPWALHLTNEDDNESPGVLNIYLQPGAEIPDYVDTLQLSTRPTDKSDHYMSFRKGALLITLFTPEE